MDVVKSKLAWQYIFCFQFCGNVVFYILIARKTIVKYPNGIHICRGIIYPNKYCVIKQYFRTSMKQLLEKNANTYIIINHVLEYFPTRVFYLNCAFSLDKDIIIVAQSLSFKHRALDAWFWVSSSILHYTKGVYRWITNYPQLMQFFTKLHIF